MDVRFVDRSGQMTAELEQFGTRRLLFALSRFSAEIRRVTVVTEDINGPRGGVDKRAAARVAFRNRGTLQVSCDAATFRESLTGLAGRVGRGVSRRLEMRRQRRNASRSVLAAGVDVSTLPAEAGMESEGEEA